VVTRVNGTPIAVVVVAEDARLRRQLAKVVRADDIELCARVATADGLATVCAGRADPVIVFNTEPEGAIAKIREVKRQVPSARMILVSPWDGSGRPLRAGLRAQVEAVVYLDQLEEALMPTVRAVDAGQVVFPSRERRRTEIPVLSHRERQVLRLAVQGCSNDEIAGRLFLATSTVKSHLTSAFAKLAVRSRSEAAALMRDPDEPARRAVFAGLADEPERFSPG
jgi:DNA-binding NarL/FixJ family response regulator